MFTAHFPNPDIEFRFWPICDLRQWLKTTHSGRSLLTKAVVQRLRQPDNVVRISAFDGPVANGVGPQGLFSSASLCH